ncbi:MAG: hypothetical protein Q9169_005215 [Polycauliona sp. 2 TL-2023]
MKAALVPSAIHLPRRFPRANACLRVKALPIIRYIATSSSNQLAQVRFGPPEPWFCSSSPLHSNGNSGVAATQGSGVDERTLKLGKTLQFLQTHLPNLLASPLPPEILSPQIKLYLFPSTHPHLPTVTGRVAYHAALWSAPVAWGRLPIVGNVQLIIISERVIKWSSSMHSEGSSAPKRQNHRLVVRWKTSASRSAPKNPSSARSTQVLYRGIGPRERVNRFTEWLSNPTSLGKQAQEFCGIFIFEFDEEGRILTHTIEHAEENGSAERASRVVNVTDWLLGRARARKEAAPELVWLVDGRKRPKRMKG